MNKEIIEMLKILKEQAETTVGNKVKDIKYTILADVRPENFIFVMNEAIRALEHTTDWIPVSYSLPNDYETVIATVEEDYGGKEYFVYPEARYSKRYGWEWAYEAGCDYWQKLSGVVAWQALPTPYRKE